MAGLVAGVLVALLWVLWPILKAVEVMRRQLAQARWCGDCAAWIPRGQWDTHLGTRWHQHHAPPVAPARSRHACTDPTPHEAHDYYAGVRWYRCEGRR